MNEEQHNPANYLGDGFYTNSKRVVWWDRFRSLAKAVSWRIVGSLDTFGLGTLLSGNWHIGVGIASAEVFTKIVLYYFHERLWRHIHTRWLP